MTARNAPLTRIARLAGLCAALACSPIWAQTASQEVPARSAEPSSAPSTGGIETKTEYIQHEDAGSRIDEVRIGGQTKSIRVQPKNGAPGYEISPERGSESFNEGGSGQSTTGRSRWRILSF